MSKLEHDSVIPLYHQIKIKLKESINNGTWNPGNKITSENQLMEQYRVSRNTVKKAIEDLVKEGVLFRIQGKGTYVSKPKLEQSLMGFYSFSRVLKEKGMKPEDIIISIQELIPTKYIQESLNIPDGTTVMEIKRIRSANAEPIILESSYIPKDYIDEISHLDKLGEISLYDLLEEKYNIIINKAKETFEPVLINEDASNYLQVEQGQPALFLERTAFDGNGIAIEFCQSIVRGDRCKFYTDLI